MPTPTQKMQLGKNLRLFVADGVMDPQYLDASVNQLVVNDVSLEWSFDREVETAETKSSKNAISTAGAKKVSLKLTAQTVYDDSALDMLRRNVNTGLGSDSAAPERGVHLQIRDCTGINLDGGDYTNTKVILDGWFIVTSESGKAELKGVSEISLSLEATSDVEYIPGSGRAFQPAPVTP